MEIEVLITDLKKAYPFISFKPGDSYYWSPENYEIVYKKNASGDIAVWSIIHEVGHALLGHRSYSADFMLIRLEVDAWEKALLIAKKMEIDINKDHIQDCLDTYRDWIFKRSICPCCGTKSFQQSDFKHYKCFNCHTTWRVTPSRFCRTYRTTEKKEPKVFV